jgi:hypothetical protein
MGEGSLRGLTRALSMTLPAIEGRVGLLTPILRPVGKGTPHAFRPAGKNRDLDRPPTIKTTRTPQASLPELDLPAAFRFFPDPLPVNSP